MTDPYTCGQCPHREPDMTCLGRAEYGDACPFDTRREDHRNACIPRSLEVERLLLKGVALDYEGARLEWNGAQQLALGV